MAVSSVAKNPDETRRDPESNQGRERLGGARAEFVANLGRRRSEIRATVDGLRGDPASKKHLTELRRRFHALGAAAKLLRFARLADELRGVESRLEEAAQRGSLEDADFGAVQDLIGRMTSLAWGAEEAEPVRAFASEVRPLAPSREPARPPVSVLVVGPNTLADALALPGSRVVDEGELVYDVERTAEVGVALDLARALAPDVIVIDADMQDARAVVNVLSSDPLTEAVPVVVTMKLARAEDAGPFLALGVAKVLAKPVSPAELRRACAAVISAYVKREVVREPIGSVSLDQLGNRLAEELRRGLCDMVDPKSRGGTVNLGEGTEVFAALWGAVARIRDVCTIRSQGAVRFVHGGPEGAVPLAPWLDEPAGSGASRAPAGALARRTEGTLEKTRVVVVDDDAAVCWFLAGVLKSAGATVYEARDGARALEIAKHRAPDLVISDVLMPGLDGFSLCRTLKRDLVLRDVPVVLLSWKEDLLQRVRELGAEADGYLRKEASATAIVQRARELVRMRQRVGQRLAARGEIRGRLDGITAYSLLRLACESRPDCTVAIRDASYLYEVEIRSGRPVRATRTSLGGTFERGPSVLGALLGVGDGRFVVSEPRDDGDAGPLRPDLTGELAEQVMPVVAGARAAQDLLTGASILRVQRVEIDEDALRGYWGATPENARAIVEALARGESPRSLIANGRASARLVEDVMMDVASHGAIVQVFDTDGEDRLPEATARELALLSGERAAAPVISLPLPTTEPGSPASPVVVALPAHADLMKAALQKRPDLAKPESPPAPVVEEPSVRPPLVGMPVDPYAPSSPSMLELADDAGELPDEQLDASASHLEDPWFGGAHESPAPRAEESPQPPSGKRALTPPPAMLGGLSLSPPPAMLEQAKAEPPPEAERQLTPTPSSMPLPPGIQPMLTLGSLHPPPVLDQEPAAERAKKKSKSSSTTEETPGKASQVSRSSATPKPADATPRFPLPSAYLPHTQAEPPKKDRKTLYWVAFALLGVVFAVWARWSREKSTADETAMMTSVESESAQQASPAPEAEAAATAPEPDGQASKADQPPADDVDKPEELPLRDDEKLKKGQGMLEVVAGKSDTVYIDGKPIGSGPTVSLPLKARKYEVRVKTRGDERTRFVEVKEGKLVRVRIAPPWQR